MVNQAIGVLITRGHFRGEAYAELRRRAAATVSSVPDAVRDVLTSTHVLTSTNAQRSHWFSPTAAFGLFAFLRAWYRRM